MCIRDSYIVFKDITLDKLKEEDLNLKEWELCLMELLLGIDFSSYTSELNASGKEAIMDILHQVQKTPLRFINDSGKLHTAELASFQLRSYWKLMDEEDILKELDNLCDLFKNNAEIFLGHQQRVKCTLRDIINALTISNALINNEIARSNKDIIQSYVAKRALAEYQCKYDIAKAIPKTQAESNIEKYSISLKPLKRKTQDKKAANTVNE
eukprot:TRINITY_DN10756_c0_g1_i2.p2 TRINITY_DN10756_c0_g1~~TRINITY_DN10756_c0_g1_i2.p2  ORF type:complete len:211 (+),score=64.14 TRINITY_DN10756_c0_g1_i2:70-702(+)